jgi:hypothetical protein
VLDFAHAEHMQNMTRGSLGAYRCIVEMVPGGIRQLPLRIGAIPLQSWTPEELMSTMSMHDSQRYVLLTETSFSFPWLGNSSVGQVVIPLLYGTLVSVSTKLMFVAMSIQL